jgi:beta-phosphoglucomutase-like phosphatase (HAD superfamily)
VYLTFVKFHDRALVNFAQGITRIDAVFAVAKRYHKAIPMAVISMDKHEDVVQLLTIAGALHLFDAVVAQQPGSRRSFSELFCIAAKHINQSSDLCLGR